MERPIDRLMNRLIAIKHYGDYSAIYAILVFRFDDPGCGLFQILWILHLRPLSFDAQYLIPDIHC